MAAYHPNKSSSSLKRMKKLKYTFILGFAIIVALSTAIVAFMALKGTDNAMKDKVSAMTSSLNVQMKLNLENYLSRMETISTLTFGNEQAYSYDATDPSNDQYEAITTEKAITDKLLSLCIMENFVDYGIVYRNNHFIGKISNGTINLFGDKLFEDLNAMIVRHRTDDGWAAGYNDDFKRIYYVKQIHENSILVISFYTTELEKVFDNPETLTDMTIRLTDNSYNVLYSSDKEDVLGKRISDSIISLIDDKKSVTVLDDDYLVTVSSVGDSWKIICSIPTKIILRETNEVRSRIIITAIIASVLASVLGMVLSLKLTDVISNMVSALDDKANTDMLTGLMNKQSFEESAENALEKADPSDMNAVILLDVDNFKGVNDTLGHAYGDKVLSKIGHTLISVFSNNDYIGRIGGDEFCILMNSENITEEEYRDIIAEKCFILQNEFQRYYTGDNNDYKISCSIGIAISPVDGEGFKELCSHADQALYISKQRGKDMYTFYSAAEED